MTAPAITMINSSGLKVHSSEQHFEMGATRTKRDYNDCKKFLKWLEERNPFLCSSKNLHSLSTGLVSITGHDDVNCENAEDIGFKIHQELNGKFLQEAKIKRKWQLISLDSLKDSINKTDKHPISINSNDMFTRLVAVFEREDDLLQFFSYGLTAV